MWPAIFLAFLLCGLPAAMFGATGSATLSSLSCGSNTATGWIQVPCTVTLSSAAPSAGFTVNLASNNSAVTLPSAVTVPAGAASAGFVATVSWWNQTAQAVALTGSGGGVSQSFPLELLAATQILTTTQSGLAFGNVG